MKTKFKLNNSQFRVLSIVISLNFLTAAILPAFTSAATPVINRGTSATYGVLAGSTITNTGTSSITGTAGSDIGLSPGTSFTGNESITAGTVNINNTAAANAQLDLTIAYGNVAGATPATELPSDLVGLTIVPGIYNSTEGTFANSGNIIFNGGGDSSSVFIFQTTTTLITSTDSTMTLTNGAQACNIYWQVGSSATLEVNSTFTGSIFADQSISALTGAIIYGQLLARIGAVTLDSNIIQNDSCVTPTPTPTPTPAPVPPAPVDVPSQPQDSSISGISSATCTTTEDYIAIISGNFPSKISNIAVNGVNIDSMYWVQSETQVALTLPASESKNSNITIYNGRVPLLTSQTFICEEPVIEVVVVTPTPTPTPTPTIEPIPLASPTPIEELKREETTTVTTTEDGGRLPDTGSDSFNYLLIGGGLLVLGSSGFLIRSRLAK